jgi:predicted SAM-dependent methyltransferase
MEIYSEDKPWSETNKIRGEVLEYCKGNGVDIGSGGDKITDNVICIDKYSNTTANYLCDARKLPFIDGVMDYVFSSHLLEDFTNTREIIIEWIRILKTNGYLILYLPNQENYVSHCKKYEQSINPSHRVNMSLDYIIQSVSGLPLMVVKTIQHHCNYSFLVVFKKV